MWPRRGLANMFMTTVRLLLLLHARWWHLDARSWHLDALTNFVDVSHLYYYMLPCLNVCIDVYVTTTTCLPTCSCLPDYWLLCLPKTSSTPLIQWLRNSILLLSGSSMASTIFFKLNLFIFLLARRRSWNISQRILQQKVRLPMMIGWLVWWGHHATAQEQVRSSIFQEATRWSSMALDVICFRLYG